jgi:hypothetical protein
MNIDVTDPAVLQAVSQALGHAPPFAAAECRAFNGTLVIERGRDLSALAHFSALRNLEITASEVVALDWLTQLPHLETLALYACPVMDLGPIAHCVRLRTVTLVGTLATQAEPLFALPSLERGTVLGQTWEAESYERFAAASSDPSSPLWEYDSYLTWQFNRQLEQYGVPGRLVVLDGWRRAIVRPGLPHYSQGNSDFIRDDEYAIELLLHELHNVPDAGPQLFDHLFGLVSEGERVRPDRHFEWHSHRELGRAERVRQWLDAAALPSRTRQQIETYLQRFPQAIFFREKPEAWSGWAQVTGQVWPDWFLAERCLLAGFYTAESMPVQFDEELVGRIGADFAYILAPSPERLPNTNRFTPLVVARSVDSLSVLVINAREPKRPRLYEGQWSQEPLDLAEFRPIVGSYTELLSHIAAASTHHITPADHIAL